MGSNELIAYKIVTEKQKKKRLTVLFKILGHQGTNP